MPLKELPIRAQFFPSFARCFLRCSTIPALIPRDEFTLRVVFLMCPLVVIAPEVGMHFLKCVL